MSNPEKTLGITKDIIEIIDHVELIIEGCTSLQTKLEKMNGRGVKARSNEAKLLNDSLDVVLSKCHKVAGSSGKKSCVSYYNQSKKAADTDAQRQHDFLKESRGISKTNDGVFGQLKEKLTLLLVITSLPRDQHELFK